MPSQQRLSPQDAFARHWFQNGYPLWNPTPVLLPQLRQTDGLKIGDVGIVDRDGCFDTLLNICDPRDRALEHEYGFPPGFTRIRQPRIINYSSFRPGHIFSSPETCWSSRSVNAPYFTSVSTVALSRVITHYTSDLSEDGAHIVVPQGAKCYKLAFQCYCRFESQANDHWSAWFDFARSQLQGPINSLYLITGVCQTRSWALASFRKKDGREIPVLCELVEKDGKLEVDASCWTPLGRFANAIGPPTEDQEHDNQTVFIQSFTITPNGVVRHPNEEQLATPEEINIVKNTEPVDGGKTAQASDQAKPTSSMPGSWPSRRATMAAAGTVPAHTNSRTIQHVPERTLPAHPSEIINRYLLTKKPAAEAAVTHDSTWIDMLARGRLATLEDLESTVDAIVSEHYAIVLRNGVVSLKNKDVSLASFGVDRSDIPIDPADCIQQDGEDPCGRCPLGSIFSGKLHTTHGSTVKVAIRVITTKPMDDGGLSEKETQMQQAAEEFILLDHSNVLPLIWACIEPGRFVMVSPWAERGTLTSYIDGTYSKSTDLQLLTLIHDVAAGLHYLHSNGVLHGCLSGSSVVIDAKGTALLSDYGILTLDVHGTFSQLRPALETMRWAVPESLGRESNLPSKTNDIYSFGSIMLQVLSGKVPYHYYDPDEAVVSAISRGESPQRPDNLIDRRWAFIQECWSSSRTSDARLSSEHIVEHAKHELEMACRKSHQDSDIPLKLEVSPEYPTWDDSKSGVQISEKIDFIHGLVNEVLDSATKVKNPKPIDVIPHIPLPPPSASDSHVALPLYNEEDDRTSLISEAQPEEPGDPPWPMDLSVDPERSTEFTPQSGRQDATSSPLGAGIHGAFRGASTRIANLGGDEPYRGITPQAANSAWDSDDFREERQWNAEDSFAGRSRPSTYLRGYTLGILGPTNPLRLQSYKLLTQPYTEPTVLVLIIVNAAALVVRASRTFPLVEYKSAIPVRGYFHAWEDLVIFGLFVIFTIEAFGRICTTGLLLNPETPTLNLFSYSRLSHTVSTNLAPGTHVSTLLPHLPRGHTRRRRIVHSASQPFAQRTSTRARTSSSALGSARMLLRSPTSPDNTHPEQLESSHGFPFHLIRSDIVDSNPKALVSLPFRLDLQVARSIIEGNVPYLQQSWGRIDSLAIIGFWVSFALATRGPEEGSQYIGIFRALSVLRITRLLALTNGTATIMHSLKIARPLLVHVIYFIILIVVSFSIIGVQLFKTSLRRSCTLLPVAGADATRLDQTCGGHIDPAILTPSPYLLPNGSSASVIKGYICPLGQVCQEGANQSGGLENFDTVYHAALQIVVLASANTWSGIMYQTIASEYVVVSIFFLLGALVLNLWLLNLLVAVITNTFATIRTHTKKGALGAAPLGHTGEGSEESWSTLTGRPVRQNRFQFWWPYTSWFWIALALASLVVQATANAEMSPRHRQIVDIIEFAITLALDVEIIVRFALEFPAWRSFFLHLRNWLDLMVAVASTIILVPVIRNSPAYPWLTVFQLARFFRVLLAVPRMKSLMGTVFGNLYGLAHMNLFLILTASFAALFAIQLVQSNIPGDVPLHFSQLFNSFLGVHQMRSRGEWTTLLYDVTGSKLPQRQPIIVSIFLCCWLLFANSIVMPMFIAVVNENFEVAEEATSQKQEQQQSWFSRLNELDPYGWPPLFRQAAEITRPNVPVMRDQRRQRHDSRSSSKSLPDPIIYDLLRRLFIKDSDDDPVGDLRQAIVESRRLECPVEHEYSGIPTALTSVPMDIESLPLLGVTPPHRKSRKMRTLRRLCQKIVRPGGGDRIDGIPPSGNALALFHLFILMAVLGNMTAQAVATPLYRHAYSMEHGPTHTAWFHITDAIFGLVLVVEFLIKIIADGFLFAPNAYIRSVWNVLDFIIMVGVVVNATVTLVFISGLSRFIRALKALQALRLMTLIEKMRTTLTDLILTRFARILDAAVLVILYLIPFSVWGANIFSGLMNECNDTGVKGVVDCTNEYVHTIHGDNFGFLVPRVWDHPSPSATFSFDSFPSSLLALFEIVSRTGWVDVLSAATSITGKGLQPQNNASQVYAIFFVLYNLLGAVMVFNLFVSIIIRNSPSQTGSGYFTKAQREWIDLQKFIRLLKPSRRPEVRPTTPFRAWCYDCSIHENWWTKMMTILFVVQVAVLVIQAFSTETIDNWSNKVFLTISFIYVVDVIIRLYGLGWRSFRAKGWNIFDVLVASGSFAMTIYAGFYPDGFLPHLLQKLFLSSAMFKVVQKAAALNNLFKAAITSLPIILNLLGLWLTFFLFFAIMFMEVFGLTKWYSAENSYQNYQTMGSTFLMLVSMNTGEGWNRFMHDYTLSYPQCTHLSGVIYQTDCGSTAWAYTAFIAWNLLSVYIFLNLFTGVVVDSFSSIFQSSGGLLMLITRHDTRAFKKSWAQFSNPETGLLERHRLAPFFAKLGGIFEVRIYPAEASVKSLLSACQNRSNGHNATGGINLRKLKRKLDQIDFDAIRRRRDVYTRIYHEAELMCWRPECKGITFTEMLTLLAHHKLIRDEEALTLKELKVRSAILELVTELVELDRARSVIRMVAVRRRYLQMRNAPTFDKRSRTAVPSWNDSDDEEGWRSEHDSMSRTSSSVVRGNNARPGSSRRRRFEDMWLLHAEEEFDV